MPIKPPDRKIKLDDYEVIVDDESYHPHEGESIWIESVDLVDLHLDLGRLARYPVLLEAIKGDPDEHPRTVELMREFFDEVAQLLAELIVRWDVTDRRGNPLLQPEGDAAIVLKLGRGVLQWLVGHIRDGDAPDRKNASRPSLTTSSDTGLPPSRASSGGGRSRQKRS